MFFTDEFAMTIEDQVFHIEVEGKKIEEYREFFTDITNVDVYNDNGDLLDSSHPLYKDIVAEAMDRHYDVDMNPGDFE